MFRTSNYTPEKVMKMDAKSLIDAWHTIDEEIQELKTLGPEMAEISLALLSDPVMLLVSRAYEIGQNSLGESQNLGDLALDFRSATEAAIQFLDDQGSSAMLKVATHIIPLQKDILPNLR